MLYSVIHCQQKNYEISRNSAHDPISFGIKMVTLLTSSCILRNRIARTVSMMEPLIGYAVWQILWGASWSPLDGNWKIEYP